MAEEITLEKDVDRVLPRQQAQYAVPGERLWEPEPFEDQRAFTSIEPEDPEETDKDHEAAGSSAEDMEEDEED